MAADTPLHFAQQFSIGPKGAAKVVQNSEEDVSACVFRIVACPQNFREDDPDFGIPEMLFKNYPLDLTAFQDAVERFEPRAELEVSEQQEAATQAVRVLVEIS